MGLFFYAYIFMFLHLNFFYFSSVQAAITDTDGSPKSHPLSGWEANKNSAFPDEIELQNLLQKLSSHSFEMRHTTGPGDTDSLSSYTSGWLFSFVPYAFVLRLVYLFISS